MTVREQLIQLFELFETSPKQLCLESIPELAQLLDVLSEATKTSDVSLLISHDSSES